MTWQAHDRRPRLPVHPEPDIAAIGLRPIGELAIEMANTEGVAAPVQLDAGVEGDRVPASNGCRQRAIDVELAPFTSSRENWRRFGGQANRKLSLYSEENRAYFVVGRGLVLAGPNNEIEQLHRFCPPERGG